MTIDASQKLEATLCAYPVRTRRMSTLTRIFSLLLLTIAILGINTLAHCQPNSLSGEWNGADWGNVVITGSKGTYTSTYGTGPGVFEFEKTGERTYKGTWGEKSKKRHGPFTLTVSEDGNSVTVNWKADDDVEVGPRNFGTSTWTRKSCAELTAEAINQDDPNNTDFVVLSTTPVLYGGSKSATSDKLKLTATVQTTPGVTVSRYTWSVSGAGAQLYKVPPAMAGFNVWNVGSIKPTPGNVTFQVVMTLSDGKTCTAKKDFEVGIRTDDTLVIGWIDATGVPLPVIDPDGHGVGANIIEKFPVNGIVTERVISGLTMGTLAGYFRGAAAPFLVDADRTYVLNWLFKFAPNPPPPVSFADEAALAAFIKDGHNYKLVNRFQIKYRVDGAKFKEPPVILKQQTAIGVTRDPISRVLDFPGQGGPTEGNLLPAATALINQISQINEGSPDQNAVKAFNFLAAPLGQMQNAPRWNDIGSMITFGIRFRTQSKIDMQKYPTYYLYASTDSGVLLTLDKSFVFPQAPNPIDNFTPHHFYGQGYDRDTKAQASSDLKLLFRRSNR